MERPDIIPDGLPDHLPEGETLLWQGRPEWKRLAVNAFHVRKVAAYFVAIATGQGLFKWLNGASLVDSFHAVPVLIGLGVAASAILLLLAYVSAKTTRYTLTSKRALMQVGIALPAIINIPYRQVDGIAFANTGGGFGNIVFRTGGGARLAYLLLWPHARPWRFTKTQPAFRDIAEVESVASRLAFVIGGQMPLAERQRTVPDAGLIAAE